MAALIFANTSAYKARKISMYKLHIFLFKSRCLSLRYPSSYLDFFYFENIGSLLCIQLYNLMGQDPSATADMLTKDQILTCSLCRKRYNLSNRAPVMVCSSQHNFCEECLEEVIKTKKCLECKDMLLLKKKRNVLLCYILEKLNLPESES